MSEAREAYTEGGYRSTESFRGEFLHNAQGPDIVGGELTPVDIHEIHEIMPDIYNQIKDICDKLRDHYKEEMYLEFTAEDKKVYILQTRRRR